MKRKLTAMVLAVAMTLGCITGITPAKAEETDLLTPVYVSDWNQYHSSVDYQWEWTTDILENAETDSEVVKLEVSKDSIVIFDFAAQSNDAVSHGFGDSGALTIYKNKLLTDEYKGLSYRIGSTVNETAGTQEIVVMPKGVYYLKLSVTRWGSGGDGTYRDTTKLAVSAFSQSDMFSVNSKAVNKGYELTCTNSFDSGSEKKYSYMYYCKGDWAFGKDVYELSEAKDSTVIAVTEPGDYTVVFSSSDNLMGLREANSVIVHHTVKGKDTTKPKVSGVKNGKTYSKAVTIKFSDKDSGIKSAKLNKKTIKSGTKVTKNGSYTLVVVDNAGNKTTVKFKIKKK